MVMSATLWTGVWVEPVAPVADSVFGRFAAAPFSPCRDLVQDRSPGQTPRQARPRPNCRSGHAMSKTNIVRVSNSFTRQEIRILKDIIDQATSQEFRGRNPLMKYIENPHFSQLYRKLASMQEKADQLHMSARTGAPEGKPEKAEK